MLVSSYKVAVFNVYIAHDDWAAAAVYRRFGKRQAGEILLFLTGQHG